jgi:hypothetical protein
VIEPFTSVVAGLAANAVNESAAKVAADWLARRRDLRTEPGEVQDPPVEHALEEWLDVSTFDDRPSAKRHGRRGREDEEGGIELPKRLGAGRPTGAAWLAPSIGAAALSIDADSVFRDARARVDRMVRLNITLAVVLASVLVAGIAGVIVCGVVLDRNVAAIAFGGMAFADVLGLVFTKPFSLITSSVVQSQRLEIAHLRLREQLVDCDSYEDAQARFQCRSTAWDKLQDELRSLDAVEHAS